MGRKRGRSSREQHATKRRRRPQQSPAPTDLDYISRDDYVVIGDFLYARPYVFEFRMNFKPRWRNQTICNVFCQEFKHTDEDYWKKELREGRILADGRPVNDSASWNDGMEVVHVVHRHESAVLSAPIYIARDEDDFVVVSKPPSLPIHPCGTYRRNSLQFVLKAFYNTGKLLAVHRLDKETSGLVIFAKTPERAAKFSTEIKEHRVQKTYLAEVEGFFPAQLSECNESIFWDRREMKASVRQEGMEAKTSFKLLKVNRTRHSSIVECKPLTGRTHQIRIHLAHLGFPIVNDPLYGSQIGLEKTNLVSRGASPLSISLTHPKLAEKSTALELRQSYLACEWARNSFQQRGQHLSCLEEGKMLSCSNCPQVTNVKNVAVQHMFIHLHALIYESEDWKFEVPPPLWMEQKRDSATTGFGNVTSRFSNCILS